jgi:hypothetical protein
MARFGFRPNQKDKTDKYKLRKGFNPYPPGQEPSAVWFKEEHTRTPQVDTTPQIPYGPKTFENTQTRNILTVWQTSSRQRIGDQ